MCRFESDPRVAQGHIGFGTGQNVAGGRLGEAGAAPADLTTEGHCQFRDNRVAPDEARRVWRRTKASAKRRGPPLVPSHLLILRTH